MRRGLLAVAAVVALGATFVAQQASGDSGALTVTGVSLPQPVGNASTASVYATIRNGTDTADRLLGVRSDVGGRTSLMIDVTRGGVGYMTDVPSIAVPAHATVALSSGVRHGMISAVPGLAVGTRVTLTFDFATAPDVVVRTTVEAR